MFDKLRFITIFGKFIFPNQVDLSAHCSYHFPTSYVFRLRCKNTLIFLSKIGHPSHFNGFHVFPRDIREAFTFMHNPFFEHSDTLLVALLAHINGKQFRCSVFTFVQYITSSAITDLKRHRMI